MVDDEPALCKTIARMLAKDHEVIAVTSTKEALGLIAGGSRFDAILSDLMMPEMSGMELSAALTLSNPEQASRMIFMTGGAFSPDAARFLNQQPNTSIEKPFRPSVLHEVLQNALHHMGTAAA